MLETICRDFKKINFRYLAVIFVSTEVLVVALSFMADRNMDREDLGMHLFIGAFIPVILCLLFISIFRGLKTAEEVLNRSGDFSRSILNGMNDAVSMIDANTYKILGVNTAFLEELGLKEEEVVGKTCYEITHHLPAPCGSAGHECPLERTRETGLQLFSEHVHYGKGGEKIYVEVSASPIKDRDGTISRVIHMARNITARRNAEEQLLESNERYRILSQEFSTLLDAIPDRLLLLSQDMKVQWANKAAVSEMKNEVQELTGAYCYELWHDRSVPCEDCHAMRSFQTGEVAGSQHQTPDGRHWDSRAFPIKTGKGNVRNVITVARDITDKKKAEREAKLIQTKMIHTNKMASLGTLVSGVAHEINNPNNLIMFNSRLISDVWQDAVNALAGQYRENGDFLLGGLLYSEVKEAAPTLISGITESAKKIKNIVDNLKDYSRHDTSNLDKPVDINNVITTSSSILKNEIKRHTDKFDCFLSERLPRVKGSPQQMEQVIINLVTNALQALPDRRRGVTIATSSEDLHVVIQVKDEGVGMSREVLDRIGEPFFTTKLDSGGTGLGLSICRSIVRDHKGSLEFASSLNEGTIVTMRLPSGALPPGA